MNEVGKDRTNLVSLNFELESEYRSITASKLRSKTQHGLVTSLKVLSLSDRSASLQAFGERVSWRITDICQGELWHVGHGTFKPIKQPRRLGSFNVWEKHRSDVMSPISEFSFYRRVHLWLLACKQSHTTSVFFNRPTIPNQLGAAGVPTGRMLGQTYTFAYYPNNNRVLSSIHNSKGKNREKAY